jgi:biotin operon repressor
VVNVRKRSETIRRFIIQSVEEHPSDLARLVSEKFGITRQAAYNHIRQLVDEGCLTEAGKTRNKTYKLASLERLAFEYSIDKSLAEDRVWASDVLPAFQQLPTNVLNIWRYSFSEMMNNAIEHSEGKTIRVLIEKTAASTLVFISDDGVGIFKKIQAALDLPDERQALLELAKGKFTTDPRHHSGEGIFFTSRMFDEYAILSGSVVFTHDYGKKEDWLLQRDVPRAETTVAMKLNNHTSRTEAKVFAEFSTDDGFGFTKTVVPVLVAEFGDDNLVSRSQARRLLTRFERFRTVVLDFKGVSEIGQAFADEVFRVFPSYHPQVEIVPVHANEAVRRMISRALSHG